jgi:putative ABC transport system permease protein
MACCLLIVLYIQDELRYDRFHERADEIYRVTMDVKLPGAEFALATTMSPLGPAMLADFPEVTQTTRTSRSQYVLTARGEQRFYESGFFYADSSFFDVFTFPLVQGDPRTALAAPFSLVLTEETARKYFGQEDPMGQVLTLYNEYDFTVTGILAPIPSASHLQFDVLASLSSRLEMDQVDMQEWGGISDAITYVVVPAPHRAADLEARLPDLLRRHMDEDGAAARTLHLQPLKRIRLYSDYMNEDADTGDVTGLYIFASIAALILLIASINFINLSTARSANRTREVGLRKVMGAYRTQLIRQFLGESMLLACIALICALLLTEALLPLFNYLLDKNLTPGYSRNPALLGTLAGIAAFVGVVAGCYPALVLSAFRPVRWRRSSLHRACRSSSGAACPMRSCSRSPLRGVSRTTPSSSSK